MTELETDVLYCCHSGDVVKFYGRECLTQQLAIAQQHHNIINITRIGVKEQRGKLSECPLFIVEILVLNPYSDQHHISPCNINCYSSPEVMRIKDMIT